MDWVQIGFGIYFALISAYLSVVLARILKQNGRVLKKMEEGFQETWKKMDQGFQGTWKKMDEGFKLIARLIVEENEKTRKEILSQLSKKE